MFTFTSSLPEARGSALTPTLFVTISVAFFSIQLLENSTC
jgi:hypothetical protein